MFVRRCYVSMVIVVLVSLTSCSSGKIKTEFVTGTVTVDGKPLSRVSVSFIPKEGSSGSLESFGRTDDQGKYTLQVVRGEPNAGTTPGDYIVTIWRTDSVPIRNGKPWADFDPSKDKTDASSDWIGVDRLPLKYKNQTTTPFTATVVKGENKFDFNLKSE